MRTLRRCGSAWIGLFLMMLIAGSVGATGVEAIQASIPSTTAHFFSSHPMIAGTVVTINDHQMVVDTEQGERITLQVDTRTMAPRDLGPGMTVRTEFSALENCRFHADRVMAVRAGMDAQRMQAYANTRHEDVVRTAAYANQSKMETRTAADDRTGSRTLGDPNPGTVMKAAPGTSAHHFSTRPMISGTVLAVNDHRMVVETDQGQKVAVVMDSRTLVPQAIAPGSIVRTEFKQMQDQRYYATRVSMIGTGVAGREQAYAHTLDSDVSLAGIVGDCESVTPIPSGNAVSAVTASHEPQDQATYTHDKSSSEPVAQATDNQATDGTADRTYDRSEETLPETASQRPWLLVVGLLALGSAGLIAVARSMKSA